jgi:putative addiction module killer protein
MIEIKEYLTPEGRSPFAEWLQGFRDRQVRARIAVRLNRLRLGNFGDCKSVGEGVYELRMAFGAGYRVYFAREADRVILLLCGGDKSSQADDIKHAKDHWRDYRSHQHG